MKKRILVSLIPLLPWFTVPFTSCSASGIVFANYESYMSPDLMDKIDSIAPTTFLPYSTNEDILQKFDKSYDIAIPSTYTILDLIKKDQVAEIDWNYFSSIGLNIGSVNNAKPRTASYNPKADATNIQSLLSDPIDTIVDDIDIYAHNNNYYNDDKSILQFSIPYFLQSFIFGYHGPEIPEFLPDSNWDTISSLISSKSPTTDPRFAPNKRSRMSMTDDSRSIFDICHLIKQQQSGQTTNFDINPNADGSEDSIEAIKNVYESFTDKFSPNTFRLNSDGQLVLYSFATPLDIDNPEYAAANGILAYNGDILYSLLGGGIEDWEDCWDETNTHIIKPDDTLVALDMCVINKRQANTNKKAGIYKDIFTTCLEGCTLDATTDGIGQSDEDEQYTYGPMMNFDYVGYTPPLRNLYQYLTRDDEQNYFLDALELSEGKAQLCSNIIGFDETNFDGKIELPLSEIVKSNMTVAWEEQREKI